MVLSAPSTLKKSPITAQLNKDLHEVTSESSRKSKRTARKLFKVSPTPHQLAREDTEPPKKKQVVQFQEM